MLKGILQFFWGGAPYLILMCRLPEFVVDFLEDTPSLVEVGTKSRIEYSWPVIVFHFDMWCSQGNKGTSGLAGA